MKLKEWLSKQGYSFDELLNYTLDEVFLYENLQLKDFNKHQAIGDFTTRFKNFRLITYGKGERSFKLIDFKHNFNQKKPEDNYISFFFGTDSTEKNPGYKQTGPKMVTDPERDFILKPGKFYIQELRFFNFWEYLDSVPGGWSNLSDSELRNEIKNILEVSDIKAGCDCGSFHYQGMNWRLSQLNGSTHPTSIAPKPRTPDYPHGWANITDGSFVCKHLSILLDYSSIMFFLNQMVMKIKKILKEFPSEPEVEEIEIDEIDDIENEEVEDNQ